MTTPATLAERLLDAQVAWMIEELSVECLPEIIERDVDEVLAIAGHVPLENVLSVEDITRVAARLATAVPASTTASTLVQTATDTAYDGPSEPVTPSQLVAREHVEALAAELLALHPVLERSLEGLTGSPRLGLVASRFVTKLVIEVLETNRAVTDRIPGVGSIMSLGTNAATRVIGAADKPLQQLLGGETAGKGAAFALRRLNKVVLETLKDPLLHEAVMEVWDQRADEPIPDLAGIGGREDAHRIAGLLQEIVIAGAPAAPVAAFADAWARAFLAIYGPYPVATLLEELDITRDDIVAELQALLPPIIAAARQDGRLERAIRTRLEPFFRSEHVTALLGG